MVAPVYKKLGLTIEEYRQQLDILYQSGLSQQQIADKLHIFVTTVEKYFKRFNLKARSTSEATKWEQKSCFLTVRQLEALDGLMLGDGNLNNSSVSARITYGCKFLETLIDIEEEFGQLHFSEPWVSGKSGCFHHKSSYYNDLLSQYNRWYKDGIKVVPEDVQLTPLSCYWWFIGDGYQVNHGLMLCTDDFDGISLDILTKKLTSIGFPCHITQSNNRIRIKGGEAAIRFLE